MIGEDGGWHKVSGTVVRVEQDATSVAVELSWGWHDRVTEERGHESHVTLQVGRNDDDFIILSLRHVGLADPVSAQLHAEGWESSLARIDEALAK